MPIERVVVDAGHRGRVEVDQWLMIKNLDCLRVGLPSKGVSVTTRRRARCADVVRLEWCHHCGSQFAVCRSCDRGQTHCSRRCAGTSRGKQLRETRRRYRQSLAGREAHRDQERRRRQRRRDHAAGRPAESVGDHPSQTAAPTATVAAQRRVSVLASWSSDRSGPKLSAAALECHRCRRPAQFVVPLGWRERLRPSERAPM